MPREKASPTFGTKLKRGDEYVARLTNINPPETTRDDKEVTDHDSPDKTKEYIPGLKDGGEVTLEGNLIPTDSTQTGLAAAINTEEPEPWAIEFPTKPQLRCTFNGYLNAYKVLEAPVDGEMKFSAKIKVTGLPVIEVDESEGLSNLVINGALPLDIMPDFDKPGEYFATSDDTDATITITPTGVGHVITINGAVVPSGSSSGPIALATGEMTTVTIRAAETGKAPAVYTIKVYRPE